MGARDAPASVVGGIIVRNRNEKPVLYSACFGLEAVLALAAVAWRAVLLDDRQSVSTIEVTTYKVYQQPCLIQTQLSRYAPHEVITECLLGSLGHAGRGDCLPLIILDEVVPISRVITDDRLHLTTQSLMDVGGLQPRHLV